MTTAQFASPNGSHALGCVGGFDSRQGRFAHDITNTHTTH